MIGSGKFESIRRNTSGSTSRRSSFFGKADAPVVERPGARECWRYIVKHQGWLSKKGGLGPTGKKWLDRYFVLYSTAMGHYLSYYSHHGDSPLFSDKRAERNLIDLGKVTFIRPVSNQEDAPPYSFDVVTIEREWTLCAPNEDEMQLWLQLLTTAVDEDVAIVPDDELCFEVKTLKDPGDRLVKFDYSTIIKVSAYGVSVGTRNSKFEYHERFFWCYTDFYKWSVQNQFGKLMLFVSVFTSNDFSQASKLDFEFRTRQAVQLASAIEFYIEKFMSIMYLKNEGEGGGEDDGYHGEYADDEEFDNEGEVSSANAQQRGRSRGVDRRRPCASLSHPFTRPCAPITHHLLFARSQFGEVEADDDEPESICNNVDLLSLDEPVVAVATAVAVEANDSFGMPLAAASVASPPPPPQQQQQQGSFDPFQDQPPTPPGAAGNNSIAAAGDLLDAFTTPTEKAAPAACVKSMEENNVVAFLRGKNEGMLFSEPGVINVMLKQEWRGSQGRVSVCIVNAGSSTMEGIGTEFTGVKDNVAALRSQCSDLPASSLAGGEQVVQQIMVECMQPFEGLPEFVVKFKVGNTNCVYNLTLPVGLGCFFEATTMEGDDFMARWQKLSSPNLQQQDVVSCGTAVMPAFVELAVTGMKMGVVTSLGEKSGGICCVGTLRTGTPNSSGGKISVGVLCRVEINSAAQAYRVTVRTAHAGVSGIVKNALRQRLLGK